jgi:3-hydroxy-9,10-secoandrosta-1,3,5(10)-triene-9,17-dione monooxygenase
MIHIASTCASTGWVASVLGVHPWHAALFAPRAQHELWGNAPDAMMSTSFSPVGQVPSVQRPTHLDRRRLVR